MTKLSIITVNRNNCLGLERTIISVINQTDRSFEYIIIDGASTDGSAALLKKYADDISVAVSEPDKGIYNAMNKGVSRATGDWCLFLNSGDTLYDENVISALWKSGCDADIICGSTLLMTHTPQIKYPHDEITLFALCERAICHQSALIRTSLLRTHPYDESMKIVSDRKFFVQSLIFDNCSYSTVDIIIAKYDTNGYSAKNQSLSSFEWQNVLSELVPERILTDYGRQLNGSLFADGPYERFFLEISRRRYKQVVYQSVRRLLIMLSLIHPSAGFAKIFPRRCQ